jgi:hypothetical protein
MVFLQAALLLLRFAESSVVVLLEVVAHILGEFLEGGEAYFELAEVLVNDKYSLFDRWFGGKLGLVAYRYPGDAARECSSAAANLRFVELPAARSPTGSLAAAIVATDYIYLGCRLGLPSWRRCN